MTETEYLDLLRFYLRNVKTADREEIIADYRSHFAEGRQAGLSDEQIAKELGSPREVYEMYQEEGVVHETYTFSMDNLADKAQEQARVAQRKAQETWNEVTPHLPDAKETVSFAVKAFYYSCLLIAVIILSITALIIFLLSVNYQPFAAAAPLPAIHPVTRTFLAIMGLTSALSVYFTGAWGKKLAKKNYLGKKE